MESSHWWQRWDTSPKSGNPFKEDSESISPFLVRSEVGDSTWPKTAKPRAKSANPFCNDIDGDTRPRTPVQTIAATPLKKPVNSIDSRSEMGNCSPLGSSTPVANSRNPFRREIDLCTFDKSTGQTAERKVNKPIKLPDDFDGKQPLKEYLMHFERCSIINGWDNEAKAMFLTASLRGESRKLLNGLTDSECRSYEKIVETLQLRFGVEKQAELHQARLLNRRQLEGESLQVLATDIRSMVDLAYQDLGTAAQERFAVQHFTDALSDKDDRFYIRREKPKTLDQALSLARELESFRLIDSNSSFRRAGSRVRALETERTALETQVDGLRHQIEQQQKQLEAQENIIKELNEFLVRVKQPQGTYGRRAPGPQGSVRRGLECWTCGQTGHFWRECRRPRAPQVLRQSPGNENRVSSRAQ